MALSADAAASLVERLRAEAEADEQKQNSGLSFLNFKDGQEETIRILPPKKGLEVSNPFRSLDTHWGLGPKGNERISCPRTYPDPQACPICDELEVMYKDRNAPGAQDFINKFKLKHRHLFQVIVRGQENLGPHLWEVSHETYTKIRALLIDNEYGMALIDPGKSGVDIKVTRKGTGRDTVYTVIPARFSSPLSEDDDQATEWLNNMIDLDNYDSIEFTEEQVTGFFNGSLSPREVKAAIYEQRKAEAQASADDNSGGKKKM